MVCIRTGVPHSDNYITWASSVIITNSKHATEARVHRSRQETLIINNNTINELIANRKMTENRVMLLFTVHSEELIVYYYMAINHDL